MIASAIDYLTWSYRKGGIYINSLLGVKDSERELLEFIGKYQYVYIADLKYFFTGTYYHKRIQKLVQAKILRRCGRCLALSTNGRRYLKEKGIFYIPRIEYRKNCVGRVKFISHLAAMYRNNQTIKFIPSTQIKDKKIYTEKSRKFVGIIEISGINYLTYHISKEHDYKYITSISYDIQKECNYKNILILIDDLRRINLLEYAFGLNTVIICKDQDKELKQLEKIHKIDWYNVLYKIFNANAYLSPYEYCDFIINGDIFVSVFYGIDTEKIGRINLFSQNNKGRQIQVVCNENIKEELEKLLINTKIIPVDLSKETEREVRVYE